jgi:Zn-dependent peptidase ImmA (M78 family)/transcriptional regulator with XRE-family HTH domain
VVTRVDVSPDLLTWAVGRAGWNDEIVQRRAPKLSEWLEGQRPTLKQLEKFAHDTHTPFGLLFLDEPPVEASPIPDMRTIGNAGLRQPSADLLDTIYVAERRQEWFRSYSRDQGAEALELVGSATIQTPVDVVASQIRQALRFEVSERGTFANWEDALRRLIDRIEALGILVMVNGVVGSNTHRKLRPEEFRGFALADPLAPLIFVNGADTKAAQIFTLIHELGHVWLGESALSDAAMTARGGIEDELWCNRLAAEVLVPLSLLRNEYRGNPDTAELERLAKRYRVSTLVVLKRIHDAGFIEWDAFQARYEAELQRVMALIDARRSPEGGGNYYYTQPLRLSRLFARAVVASTKEGGTAYRDAYQLLGTKKHETFENLAAELGVG